MGPINAAFTAENLWKKYVSAHKLNGGGPIVRERNGGGEGFEVEWPGG